MKRFEVWWVPLDPATGSEMRKTRPCVVVSRDAMNARLRTVIVAPLTRGGFEAPFRVACSIAGQDGQIALDQMRVVDKARLAGRIGALDSATAETALRALAEMFKG
ncbi:MAG: type II toxin-antitoxin system PemK/MazF family toxin [Verrucomicrobia bacterium]|nr:type II toxin-antitoxin system PemK/MazF family toxin [Verrucomicrobiota bacterium]